MENILEVKKLSKKYDGFEFKNNKYRITQRNSYNKYSRRVYSTNRELDK